MKRNTTAILILLGAFLLVVALNFVFFVDSRPQFETETTGNRSSYRTTPFGTSAFYTLLEESGYKVARFRKPFTQLKQSDPSLLLIIAPPESNNPTEDEISSLDKWIDGGGVAVIVDRDINLLIGGAKVETEAVLPNNPVRTLQP